VPHGACAPPPTPAACPRPAPRATAIFPPLVPRQSTIATRSAVLPFQRWAARAAAVALVVTLGCARAAPVAATGPLRPADETAIRATLDGMARAWNAADLPAHVAPYLDSASFMGGDGPIRGRERTAASLQRAFWRDGRPTQALRFERIEARPLGPDHALVTGRFVLAGGGAAERSGWYTLVWVRTADGWRILHDHSG